MSSVTGAGPLSLKLILGVLVVLEVGVRVDTGDRGGEAVKWAHLQVGHGLRNEADQGQSVVAADHPGAVQVDDARDSSAP